MNKETITLHWIKKSRAYQKAINRKELLSIMESLKAGFSEDNEISKQLFVIIPEIESMKINYDANETKDVPLVSYKKTSGEEGAISIIRHHKIIWSILDKYCS